MRRRGILAAWLAAWLVVSGCGRPSPTLPAESEASRVIRVVDGDTLVVAGDQRVRLIGIDAPESVKPNSPVECYGREASRYLELLLPAGTPVRLEADVEARDRYGRMLAYVYRAGDGLFVNAAMVRDGYAQPLTIPPNVAHADDFVILARQARQASRGLWSACPQEPATG